MNRACRHSRKTPSLSVILRTLRSYLGGLGIGASPTTSSRKMVGPDQGDCAVHASLVESIEQPTALCVAMGDPEYKAFSRRAFALWWSMWVALRDGHISVEVFDEWESRYKSCLSVPLLDSCRNPRLPVVVSFAELPAGVSELPYPLA